MAREYCFGFKGLQNVFIQPLNDRYCARRMKILQLHSLGLKGFNF